MSELKWTTVDTSELRRHAMDLYKDVRKAYRAYAEARALFEAQMQGDWSSALPQGTELKFGYNSGELSMAVGPKTKAEKKQGLADWLAAQGA